MVYKCKNCGAKLSVKKKQSFVKCSYCGTNNKIEYTQSDYLRESSKRSKKYTKYILIGVGIVTLIGLIPGIWVSLSSNNATNNSTNNSTDNSNTQEEKLYYQYSSSPAMVDYNDDKILDIVAIAEHKKEYGSNGNFLHLIKSNTGDIIDSVKIETDNKAEIFSVTDDHVFLTYDFILKVYDKNLTPVKTLSLIDQLEHFDVYSDINKLFLELYGRIIYVLDMQTWELEKAADQTELSRRTYKFNGISSGGIPPAPFPRELLGKETISKDGVKYTIEEKGSRNLMTVYAKKNNKELWKLPLSYTGDIYSWDPYFDLIDQVVVLFGEKPDTEEFYIVGIDKDEGIFIYDKKIDIDGPSSHLTDVIYNGKYIIAAFDERYIIAFEPATGKVAWHIGEIR